MILEESVFKSKETKPPLLFIHGSVHGAWCWKVNRLKEAEKHSLCRKILCHTFLNVVIRVTH